MPENVHTDKSMSMEQMKQYASDLAAVYRSEREKSRSLKMANDQLVAFADDLKQTITELRSTNRRLEEAYLDTIYRLSLAAEFKDEDTGDHILRMSHYSGLLAEMHGLPAKAVKRIRYAAPMHDIGKIGIPDGILGKPGKLSAEEFEVIKTHTTIGARLLSNSNSDIIQTAHDIALCHHEKWNGSGYPHGIRGADIPIEARIVALADVFDALTSKRPYKEPFSIEKSVDIIRNDRGSHFDPDITDLFLDHLDAFVDIKNKCEGEHVSSINFADQLNDGIPAAKARGQSPA